MKAPTTPGTYTATNQAMCAPNFRMLQEGIEWFGETCGPASITVVIF